MIRAALALLVCSLAGLGGCTTYSIRPFYDQAAGREVCCSVFITSTRNVASASVDVAKQGENYTGHFSESGVSASVPISAGGTAVGAVAGAVIQAAKTIP